MSTTIPLTLTEYNAVRQNGCGVIDLSSRGRFRVSGSEAVMFLNGLITNDMNTLAEQRWMPAAFPNVQGRLIAAVRISRLQGDQFLLDTEAATHEAVRKTIERFTMAGDFKVQDVTAETSMLSVQGPTARERVTSVLASATDDIPRDGLLQTVWHDTEVIGIRSSHTAEDGFDLIVASDRKDEFDETLKAAACISISGETVETLRIEAGIGFFGRDMDETNVITEANLDDAVSFTKGCYIGQEIIARIKYRGHVAKKLTGLLFQGSEVIERGAVIKSSEGKDIGRTTSVTFSPRLEKTIALGYVRYEHLAPGTNVIVGESAIKATVSELPFIRGSWYENT